MSLPKARELGTDAKRAFGLTQTPSARGFGGGSGVPQWGVGGDSPNAWFQAIETTKPLI
ncbi:hypothetical protein [Oscillatoria sp. FACHB-1407]|uniref:hypothetical protein n=1 Tax=Oscillatoria sp. FACHB-1407 TaxID=2692847 RepID=UPI0030DA6219